MGVALSCVLAVDAQQKALLLVGIAVQVHGFLSRVIWFPLISKEATNFSFA